MSFSVWSFVERIGPTFDEANAQVNQAIALDPLSSLYRNWLSAIAYFSGQYDLAITLAESLSDEWAFSLAWPYAEKKMYPEAIANFEKSMARAGRQTDSLGGLAWVYGMAGRKVDARKIISELRERSRHHYVFPTVFANAYLGLGDKDRALTYLEQAYEEQDPALFYLKVVPFYDPLRSEPRFQDLLRRVNLSEAGVELTCFGSNWKTVSSVPPTLRFGVFELDPRAGELRKKWHEDPAGQGQPVRSCRCCWNVPGGIREPGSLRQRLWPADTFVDFEQG